MKITKKIFINLITLIILGLFGCTNPEVLEENIKENIENYFDNGDTSNCNIFSTRISGSDIKSHHEIELRTEIDGATIMYTLDGSIPTKDNGEEYINPIKISSLSHDVFINNKLVLKAIAIKPGLDNNFIFQATYNVKFSNKSYLTDIEFSEGTLSPEFSSTDYEYSLNVANEISSLSVSPVTDKADTVITVNDETVTSGEDSSEISLDVGSDNVITIILTYNDTITTYTINVTRQSNDPSDNADLSSLTISEGTLTPVFNKDTLEYTATVDNAVTSVNIGAQEVDNTASFIGTGDKGLSIGVNEFDIVVTAEDGTKKTYTINITRQSAEPSNNADLSSLTISEGTLTPAFDKDTLNYTATVENAIASIDITAEEAYAAASSTGAGTKSLAVGTNEFNIVVTAEDETVKTYSISITREASGITVPVVTASPNSKSFTDSITVELSVDKDVDIHYTTNGDVPTSASDVYSTALNFTETTTLITFVENEAGSDVKTFSYTKSEGGDHPYYKTNPNGQVGMYSSGMNVVCESTMSDSFADWSEDMIIAQGVANDDARAFKGGHEYPVYDSYALYAAWDDENLYIGWQFVYVNDVVDPANNGGNEAKPTNGDIPQMLVFDTDPTKSSTGALGAGDIWGDGNGPYKRFDLSMGVDTALMFSSKGGVGAPGVFTMNGEGDFDYTPENCRLFNTLGIIYGAVYGLQTSHVYGLNQSSWGDYAPADLLEHTGWVDMLDEGHNSGFDCFYEMKIPFDALGIDRNYIENTGIGVMHVSTYGLSAVASIPFDMATLDSAEEDYTKDFSSTHEKEDLDNFTSPLARIGKL